MTLDARKHGILDEGGDLEILEGITLAGQEAPDFLTDDFLFRLALINEVKRLREQAEISQSHGFVAELSETLVKDSLG